MPNDLVQSSMITAKGQTTIPKAVRDTLGLASGDRICFQIGTDVVTVRRMDDEEDPAMVAFLAFLEGDITHKPQGIRPLSDKFAHDIAALTKDMVVNLDDDFIGDVSL